MLQNIARQIAARMTIISKTNPYPSNLNPSPALRATYQKPKQLCSTPRYIIARERENARLLAIKMRKLHDKRKMHALMALTIDGRTGIVLEYKPRC